jgi:hypothetical protein
MIEEIENTPEWLSRKESILEENITQLLRQLGIDASVKTDKKSLPYKETFETILSRTKPFSESFHFREIYREFTKEILNKGYRKIRFYCELIQMDLQMGIWDIEGKTHQISLKPDYKCSIKYYIHY